MTPLIRMELRKALRNPWFAIAVVVALSLAVHSAVANILGRSSFGVLRAYDYRYLSPSADSCFSWWISLDFAQPSSTLFFQLMPLLTVIPYSWSYRTEFQTGYLMQIASRQTMAHYLVAKGIAVFIAGALVAAIPIAINFVILACFIPAYMPDVTDVVYLGVYSENLWSWFFYNLPLLYVALYTLLAGLLSGLWALFVHTLSFLIDNRVALLSAPYLGLLGIQYVADRIWLALGGINGVQLGLAENMRAAEENYFQSGWVILGEIAVLLGASIALTIRQTKKDVL